MPRPHPRPMNSVSLGMNTQVPIFLEISQAMLIFSGRFVRKKLFSDFTVCMNFLELLLKCRF